MSARNAVSRILTLVVLYAVLMLHLAPVNAQAPLTITLETVLGRGYALASAWSPDGNTIAVGSSQGIWLYHPDFEGIVHLGDQPVTELKWHPNGELLASLDSSGVTIWNTTTGSVESTVSGSESVGGWNADGSLFAVQQPGNTIEVWDTATGDMVTIFAEHEDWVEPEGFAAYQNKIKAIEWSLDGTRIASVDNYNVYIWNALTGNAVSAEQVSWYIRRVAWSPDGTQLAGVDGDTTVTVWDAVTGEALAALQASQWYARDLDWSPDGTSLAAVALNSITLRNTTTWGITAEFEPFGDQQFAEGDHRQLMWSPDGTRLLTSTTGSVQVLDAATGTVLASTHDHAGPVNDISWSPDSVHLASAHGDLTYMRMGDFQMRVWDAAAGQVATVCSGHSKNVTAVDWSPNGLALVSASSGFYFDDAGGVRLWQAIPCVQQHVFRRSSVFMIDVAWSSDGQYIAVQDGGGTAIWDVGQPDAAPRVLPMGLSEGVVWHPVHSWLAFDLGRIEVYDTADAVVHTIGEPFPPIEPLQTFPTHIDIIRAMAWDHTGTRLAAGGGPFQAIDPEETPNYTIEIWDTMTSALVQTLGGHEDGINSISWDPTGHYLASASADGTVRVWDVTTGDQLAVLEGHTDTVSVVAWSPDGARLATGSYDGTVRLWRINN